MINDEQNTPHKHPCSLSDTLNSSECRMCGDIVKTTAGITVHQQRINE